MGNQYVNSSCLEAARIQHINKGLVALFFVIEVIKMFDENDNILLGSEEESLTGGSTDTPTDTISGGTSGNDTLSGNIDPVVDEEDDTTVPTTTVTFEDDSILNPEYVENVKQSQFGELYNRLVSDEQESQCAEFLAPQLIKQDRLYNHTFNAAFGQFY